jgi:hypothetical protein
MMQMSKDLLPTLAPEAPAAVVARLAGALAVQRAGFQRGLGEAGTCVRATMVFDDMGSAPALNFHVELEGGVVQVFGEHVTSSTSSALKAEERGAAAATAIKTGLIRPRGAA